MDKRFIEALNFAALKHRKQYRDDKDKTPYINHPINLAHILAVEAGIEDVAILITALLHDTIEDTDTTMEDLAIHFGPRVANLVAELSDDQSPSIGERYEAQIRKTLLYSPDAKLIKLADRIANIRDALNNVEWTQERLFGHFKHARRQVDLLSGTNEILENLFDAEYSKAATMMQANSA